MKPSNDKEAITLILQGMTSMGYTVTSVQQDIRDKYDQILVSEPEQAAALVCECDEGLVYLNLPNSDTADDGSEGWDGYIYFVLGNEPEEVACDYTTNLDPDLDNIISPWWQ